MSAPKGFAPARVLALSLGGLIAAGTVLLALPLASTGERLSVVDAFFTATSAVCVTGLIVVDTPTDLSFAGQAVVLGLIQAGGLGYMVITSVVAVALGRRLSMGQRLALQGALNVDSMEGLGRFAVSVLKTTLVLEGAGALILAAWWADEMGAARAAWSGLFHAVSAFNNAGFALFPDSLVRFRGDWLVNSVVMTLVVAGGLGFVVLRDLWGRARGRRLSVHSRVVLVASIGLVAATGLAVWLLERGNPGTLAPLPPADAGLAALFQAVTPRTAGFNTLDVAALTPPTLFLFLTLMFVGAAPGGTAGGIKVTTVGITVAALWAMVRGRADTNLAGRRLPPETVARAFVISLTAFLALNVTTGAVLIVEGRALLPTLFEVTSAFGTVGLSTGESGSPLSLSGHFSATGKLLIAAMMFLGRTGPLTLALAVAGTRDTGSVRRPEGHVLIG